MKNREMIINEKAENLNIYFSLKGCFVLKEYRKKVKSSASLNLQKKKPRKNQYLELCVMEG